MVFILSLTWDAFLIFHLPKPQKRGEKNCQLKSCVLGCWNRKLKIKKEEEKTPRNWELKGKGETLIEEGTRRREGRAGPMVLRTISTFSESCSSMTIPDSNDIRLRHDQYQLIKNEVFLNLIQLIPLKVIKTYFFKNRLKGVNKSYLIIFFKMTNLIYEIMNRCQFTS